MDGTEDTIAQLRLEADNATARAEEAEAKYKRLEQEVMTQYGPQLAEAKNQLTEAIDRLSEANKAVSAAEMCAEEIASQFREVIVGTQDLERRIKNLEQLRDQSDTKYEELLEYLRCKKELGILTTTKEEGLSGNDQSPYFHI